MVKFSKKKNNKKPNKIAKLVPFKSRKLSKKKNKLIIAHHNTSNKNRYKDLRTATMKNFTIPKTTKIFIGGASTSSPGVIDLAWNSLKNEFEAPTDFMPDYQLNNLLIKLLNDNINNKNNNENQVGGMKGAIERGMQMWEERKERKRERLRNEKMAKKAEKEALAAEPSGRLGWKTKQAKQKGEQAYKNAMEEAKTQQLKVKAEAAAAVMKELRKAKEDKEDYVPPVILENAARTKAEALAKTLGATDIVNVDKINPYL